MSSSRIRSLLLLLLLSIAVASEAQESVAIDELVRFDDTPLDRRLNGNVVSYAESLSDARPAVVTIISRSTRTDEADERNLLERFFDMNPHRWMPLHGLGSGVIVSENGYILTNNHVVGFADEITVQLDNQRTYEARLVGADPGTDIAVVKIEAEGLPTIALADSDRIEVGDVVFAIGNPLGVGKTVTMGIVSATNRQNMGVIAGGFENFIQTDASINTGNSGGALVDAMGRLIGINTLIQTDGASSGNIGIGFAVPVNLAYSVMVDLIQSGAVSRGFLGVGIEGLSESQAESLGVEALEGALINLVSPDSPAAKAKLELGDLIVSVDGVGIKSPSDLRIRIAGYKPGSTVELGLVRGGAFLEVEVTLAERSSAFEVGALHGAEAPTFFEGVAIELLDPDLRSQFGIDESIKGVVVADIAAETPFANEFVIGMVILKINGKEVTSVAAANEAVNRGGKNKILVYLEGVYRVLTIED